MRILIDGQTLETPEINRGIGSYFKNILENILKNDFSNEWYINISSDSSLNHFSPWVRSKLNIIDNGNYNTTKVNAANNDHANELYSDILNFHLKKHEIDIYWNPNPLMMNVLLPKKKINCKFSATIYDLIPLIMADTYFKQWPKSIVDNYKSKLKILEESYDLFLHISHHTEADVKNNLKVENAHHAVTLLAADDDFLPYPFPSVNTPEKYILYVGGFDLRKNMYQAIEAFANLQKRYVNEKTIQATKLYIVCSFDEVSKRAFLDYTKNLGIEGKVWLTGFLDKRELIAIYQKASCFFFPSLYEGFGLCVLEAFACGLPVACSNTSSLSEFSSEFTINFDPCSVEDMTRALHKALNESLDYEARVRRYEYSKRFSWINTATDTLRAFENILEVKKRNLIVTKRKKIAWLSPLPPQKSGVANYSNILINELKNFIDIDLYYDGEEPTNVLQNKFVTFPISKFIDKRHIYDKVIYHIGNSRFHLNIYKLAWDNPDTVVLHDYNIHPFMQYFFPGTSNEHLYKYALIEGYGEEGYRAYKTIQNGGSLDIFAFPLSKALIQRSKKVIVHNMWVKKQLKDSKHINLIPHFAQLSYTPTNQDIAQLKTNYKIKENDFVISCIGFINKNKGLTLQIAVIKRLLRAGYPIKMIFGGEISPEVKHMVSEINKSEYRDYFIFTGFQDEKQYSSSIFASDIIINLRYPSMGETSGTLMQALAAGKAILISDVNQYQEFPDDICLKIQQEGNEDKHLYENIKLLLDNKHIRERFQKRALEYSKRTLGLEKVVHEYLKCLNI